MLLPQAAVQIRVLRENVSVYARMRLDHTASARRVRDTVDQDQAAEIPVVGKQIQRHAFVGADLTDRDLVFQQGFGGLRTAVVDVDLFLDSRNNCRKLLVRELQQVAFSDLQRLAVQPEKLGDKARVDKQIGSSRQDASS